MEISNSDLGYELRLHGISGLFSIKADTVLFELFLSFRAEARTGRIFRAIDLFSTEVDV
jgi:hypothetical protein